MLTSFFTAGPIVDWNSAKLSDTKRYGQFFHKMLDQGVYVIRVDKRVLADSAAWAKQKQAQRTARLQQLRQQRIQMFLQDIRKAANIDDRRREINAATRRSES